MNHKSLAAWYIQLARSLEVGMTLANALQTSHGPPAKDLLHLSQILEAGCSVDDLLQHAPKWLPQNDQLFISAAAQTGRLPQTLEHLSERHLNINAHQTKLALASLYPLGIIHFGILIIPIINRIDFQTGFQWDTLAYLQSVLSMLLPLWLILGSGIYLARNGSPIITSILQWLPIVRGYQKSQALAEFCQALGTFLTAGVIIDKSWAAAALVSQNKFIKKAANEIAPHITNGQDPADFISQFKCFPADFVALYKTGAKTGTLDQSLFRLANQYQGIAKTKLTLATVVYPTVLFLGVIAFIIMGIFKVYGSYIHTIQTF